MSLYQPPDTLPALVAPAPDPSDVRNASGEVERVWWNRTIPVGYNWTEKTACRVVRRTAKKVRVAYLRYMPTSRKAKTDPEAWGTVETWVLPEKLLPRTAVETHTAKTIFPEF